MSAKKRKIEILVLSDIHLGTYGCRANELLQYLKAIKPKTVILNGDIIDMWQFNKRYWPKSHMRVVKHITGWIAKGVKVVYITGNHDEMLRKFAGFNMGSFEIANQVLLDLGGKKTWIFHGDVFDVSMKHSRWLAKLGAVGYDTLIVLNTLVNFILEKLGRGRISLSQRIKNGVKSAVKFIDDFEDSAATMAVKNGYQYVVCGHIHQPQMRTIQTSDGPVEYLNSGDWIENLSALEYHRGSWSLYRHNVEDLAAEQEEAEPQEEMNNEQLFAKLLLEFQRSKEQEEEQEEEPIEVQA